MSRYDWYRNKTWDSEIEAAFRAKLARARSSRPQYLVIQAGMIARSHPDVALNLIDEYLGEYREFNFPSAQCVRAEALLAQGEVSGALDAFKCALDWEESNPNYLTGAAMRLARLVVDQELFDEYEFAWSVLHQRPRSIGLDFPVSRYEWNGCCALILAHWGKPREAKQYAEAALEASRETQSPFRYHRGLGLVKSTKDRFGTRLKTLVNPPFWRRFVRD